MNGLDLLCHDPLTVTREMLDPTHVGTCLSRLCRYGGAGKFPLSVAQHCVLLSYSVPKHLRFAALTHDVPEIWIGEIPTSTKHKFADLIAYEDTIMAHLAELWDEPWEHYEEIVAFDHAIRKSEVRALFDLETDEPPAVPVEPAEAHIMAGAWAGRFNWLVSNV